MNRIFRQPAFNPSEQSIALTTVCLFGAIAVDQGSSSAAADLADYKLPPIY
jgi:hypothetical protein